MPVTVIRLADDIGHAPRPVVDHDRRAVPLVRAGPLGERELHPWPVSGVRFPDLHQPVGDQHDGVGLPDGDFAGLADLLMGVHDAVAELAVIHGPNPSRADGTDVAPDVA